ncbi:SDR family oxidoreductase [Aliarcobacter butzleri]|uniref:SDR family NAD(P)-dependent oxidoreductase n=1 Tax=Aliarcobacter butzleri TaxID=28197 RepID=UPI0021B46C2F|nr:SDR family oxidoreductase [Aliarcobacter butzleri]MCT7582052.1 SDR family oxidoreductase [Aliarcobacter butzleri]
MISFKNKKILVTGASSGIGREVAIHLSELEAKVVLIARDEDRLKETISLMKEPKKHKYFLYDLENIDDISTLVTNCVEYDNIKFDGFIHCAGVPALLPLKVLDYKKFEKVFKINTYSYLEIIKYLSKKQNSNDEASIIFLSSIIEKYPKKAQIPYVMSKVSADNISKAISLELQKRKIRVNGILVGSVETKMVEDTEKYRELTSDLEKTNSIEHYSSIFKLLSTREVSNMVMFLLSDSARYIVGENYFIDGGYFI